MDNALLLGVVLGGIAVAALALIMRRKRSRGRNRDADDVFALLGTGPEAALARIAPPPVDLSQPIADEAQWSAVRNHASDPAYRDAVDMVRGRYRFANPMLLPNTLRAAMEKSGTNFREAVLEIAKDDGLR